jgi:hypothetical protein
MSTISSTKEAYEALCAGELFQVGGRFINPADIVEVDPNGGQNPIFRLADGRTVQHDRFKEGDVGDFLADALEYATRGQGQKQAIKPDVNVFLDITSGSIRTINEAGKKVQGYGSGKVDAQLNVPAREVVAFNGNGNAAVYDYDDGTTKATANFSYNQAFVSPLEGGGGVFCNLDGGNEMNIKRINADGTVDTLENNNSTIGNIRVGMAATSTYGSDGTIFMSGDTRFSAPGLLRYDIASGTETVYSNATAEPSTASGVALDTDRQEAILQSDGTVKTLPFGNASASESTLYSAAGSLVRYDEDNGRLYHVDDSSGKLTAYDRQGNQLLDISTPATLLQDGGLDLDRV